MTGEQNVNLGFAIDVVEGDAFKYPADVLAVKDSPRSGGLDAQVRRQLKETSHLPSSSSFLEPGEYRLFPADKFSQAKQYLIVGAPSIFQLHYEQLRDLGQHFLEALWDAKSNVRHLLMTVHGIQTALALDEVEAFRSLLMGMSDAYAAGHYPPTLRRITFIERNPKRADLLRGALRRFLPTRPVIEDHMLSDTAQERLRDTTAALEVIMSGPESFEPEFRKPEADETTPHVFVAMPFADTYDDQFYLAIQPTVTEAGFLCERMDLDTFTGDIMQRMFDRIRSAQIMIALLDGANPNVYLEVGYAWCAGTPVILVAHRDERLPFDVQSHRVLFYDKIYLLKQMLESELARLAE